MYAKTIIVLHKGKRKNSQNHISNYIKNNSPPLTTPLR